MGIKIPKISIPFRGKKKEKNCKDLGVGYDLTEFAKIHMPESLNIYIYLEKKDNFGILTGWVKS
jgi:hypothetical protein